MSVKRLPIPVLRPFVTLVWDSDQAASSGQPLREHLLPSGAMHLVFRLTDCQLCIFDAPDTPQPQRIGGSIIGGIRSRFYIRESFGPSRSVGAVLRPGTAELLFGATAEELAEKHTPLESLWGGAAQYLRERLLETENAAERLTVLETSLAARLPRARCLQPGDRNGHRCDAVPAIGRGRRATKRHQSPAVHRPFSANRGVDAENVFAGAAFSTRLASSQAT